MRKRIATWITLVVGLLVIACMVSAALYLAHRQSVREESAAVSAMTGELLRRADEMGDQATNAYLQLKQARLDDPCSEDGLALMREIGMKANYLQAVGYVEGEHLKCSSFGRYRKDGLPLGPAAYVSALGTRIRPSVDLGLDGGRRFLILEKDHYAAAVHPATMLDVFIDKPDVSLGIYGLNTAVPLATRGTFDPAWARRLGEGDQAIFFDGRHLVAIRRSRKFDLAAYSAIPAAQITARLREVSVLLVPLGLLFGLGLSLAMILLARRQNSMPATLRLALRKREFVLHYQPIVALASGRMVGVEALMRWPREGGEVRPEVFIPAAEDSGLIGQFTEYVLDQLRREAPGFLARHPECYIGINLSSTDLHGGRIVESLKRLASIPGIAPANLMVEVTEHSFLDADVASAAVKAIRALGIRVAIDDFGTGFSNLSHLARLKTDCLKIDKVFIEAIGTHAATGEVALHIIHMAESLGLTVIGEGIETEAQAAFLREYGVEFGQGWLYARAMPMADLLAGRA
jgi:sensor c-di-GMP phosphodiesterase-like protein